MDAEALNRTATELRKATDRLKSLANLIRYGVLVDARSTALRIAAEIHVAARELEARADDRQLQLVPDKPQARKEAKP